MAFDFQLKCSDPRDKLSVTVMPGVRFLNMPAIRKDFYFLFAGGKFVTGSCASMMMRVGKVHLFM